ncbi:MAG: UvrD-helicase domain-containing protein [Thermoanaerobaculia bacterium]
MTRIPPLDLESNLNTEQLAAVTHGEGPQLVLAGAGSGKTRVITYRIAWLVGERGVDPGALVAVTFTNKAAAEMGGRVERLLGLYPLPTFVGTFHRFALRLLRRYGERVGVQPGFAVFDAADQIALVKKALRAEGLDESAFAPRSVLAAISSAKNRLLGPAAYEAAAGGFFTQGVARVYRRYQGMLVDSSGVDFDDMLRLAVGLLVNEPEIRDRLRRRVDHLLVDEFQDTNHAQMRLVRELIGEQGNLTAVGDEDQGIYGWRGADLDNVLEFEKSFPGAVVRKLERNYRSTQNILSAAGGLVEHNRRRRGKRLWTAAGEGEPVELYRARDDQDEARWVVNTLEGMVGEMSLSEMAILVRTNAQTRSFEEELLRRQIPYSLVGGVRFYERAEIKDLLAYLRLAQHPRDNFSLLRVLNQPPRGIGKATRELLESAAQEYGHSLWEALCHAEFSSFPARSARALEKFRDLVSALRAAAKQLTLPELLQRVIEDSGYADLYRNDEAESQSRLENIGEFLTAVREFSEKAAREEEGDPLTVFLDHVSLVSELDAYQRGQGVALMTLHSAKGLEFRCAVIAGLEDGLLPHFNSFGEPEDLEEERRLLYVGMTRAKERLFLTCCRRRRIAGRYQEREESPFLLEIPAERLKTCESPELFYGPRTRGAYEFFGRSPADGFEFDQEAGGELQRGRRVCHPTLGEGVLLDLEGEGEDSKITVFFERVGKRKLIAKYANLRLL